MMCSPFSPGNVAVVTGGGSGIGRALSIRLAELGLRVAVLDQDGEAATQTVKTFAAISTGRAFTVDVADADAMLRCADEVLATFGSVNVLCNNAGILRAGTAWTTSPDHWELTLSINVRGVANGLAAFLPSMIASGCPAHVLNTASIGGLGPAPGFASYIASKYAVVGLTETLRDELLAEGHSHIGVSVLCPGGVSTAIWQSAKRAEAPVNSMARNVLETMAAPRPEQATSEAIADLAIRSMLKRNFWIIAAQSSLHGAIEGRLHNIAEAMKIGSVIYD